MINFLIALLYLNTSHAGITRQNVNTMAAFGNPQLIGNVTLTAGSNISLGQTGNQIFITGTASGSSIRVFSASWGGANTPSFNNGAADCCTADPCTLATQIDSSGNTNTISVVNRNSTGAYTLHITSGRCSTIPACVFALSRHCESSGQQSGNVDATSTPTTTTINFVTDNTASVNGGGYINCICVP